jgi:hypothetical protein
LVQRLIKFFPEKKKPKHAKRIFKASDHEFNIYKYFELCGQEVNNMVLCKTHKNKVIGGFTPLSFRFNKNDGRKWINDPS